MAKKIAFLPGLIASACVASLAWGLHLYMPGFSVLSPVFLGAFIGLLIRNTVRLPSALQPGQRFAMKTLLRLSIVLLGARLAWEQIVTMGFLGALVVTLLLVFTFVVTVFLGRLLGVSEKLSILVATGTSICGVSAIMAANSVVQADDDEVSYAVGSITLFGTLFMLSYPFLSFLLSYGASFDEAQRLYGLWAGSSIHEVAQVAGATASNQIATSYGVISKLLRVALLPPVILGLAWWISMRLRSTGNNQGAVQAKIPFPWFLVGFLAVGALNSLGWLPSMVVEYALLGSSLLMVLALSSVGLETDLRRIIARGVRPLLLGALSSLFIAFLALISWISLQTFGVL